jgi:cysteine desulfurase family protein (TIGR01976 family)
MQPQPDTQISVEQIRSQFPALDRIHNGFPVAYFDGPGGTQVPRVVVERMNDYLYNHNANTHWNYPTSHETDRLIDEARDAFADFFNSSASEIVFGQNMTTLAFHLSRSLGRRFETGDEIVVTELDHHANIDAWRALEKDRGVNIKMLPLNIETGELELDVLTGLLSDRTRLVAIGAASNAIGTINDVKSIVKCARDIGALTFVDAVHIAPHKLIDVKDLDCDLLACSAYKFYGPHIGIMYGRRELLEEIDFPKVKPAPDSAPERIETGTQNHEGIVGAAAAVDFMASLGRGNTRRERLADAFALIHERDVRLTEQLWNGLSQVGGVRIYGPKFDALRTSLVSFTVGDHKSRDVAAFLADRGLFLSHGNFYAATVVERLGLAGQGLLRAGCSLYTTADEIQRLVEGVREFVVSSSVAI